MIAPMIIIIAYVAMGINIFRYTGQWVINKRLFCSKMGICPSYEEPCSNCGQEYYGHNSYSECKAYVTPTSICLGIALGLTIGAISTLVAWPLILVQRYWRKFAVNHLDAKSIGELFFKESKLLETKDQKIKRLQSEVDALTIETDERLAKLGIEA